MFIKNTGKTKTIEFPKAASTAFTIGQLVAFDGSGNITPATSSSTLLVGVVQKTVTSTDTDYALNTPIPVEVPVEKYAEFIADTTGAAASNVGGQYDLTDANNVNLSGTSRKVVTVTRLISATKVAVILNAAIG